MTASASGFDQLIENVEADDAVGLARQTDEIRNLATATDVNGRSLLHHAVHARASVALAWLIDQRLLAVDARDNQGETALMRAASMGEESMVSDLLAAGADPNAAAFTGCTSLHYAYAAPIVSPSVIAQLMEAGADPSALDKMGRPPVGLASEGAHHRAGAAALEKVSANQATPRRVLAITRPLKASPGQ